MNDLPRKRREVVEALKVIRMKRALRAAKMLGKHQAARY